MLTDYEHQQLTSLSECSIHFHPREQADLQLAVQLQEATPVKAVATGATLGTSDYLVTVDPAAGAATLSLPQALKSREYRVVMVGAGTLTISPDGADTIIGAATLVLSTQWESVHLKSDDNGNWLKL